MDRVNGKVGKLLDAMAGILAQEAAEYLEAFDRFCRAKVGLSAIEVFAAWAFPFGEARPDLLKECTDAKPRESRICELEASILRRWNRHVRVP